MNKGGERGKNTYSAHSKADILIRMMIVNVSVSFGLYPHVKEAMRRQLLLLRDKFKPLRSFQTLMKWRGQKVQWTQKRKCDDQLNILKVGQMKEEVTALNEWNWHALSMTPRCYYNSRFFQDEISNKRTQSSSSALLAKAMEKFDTYIKHVIQKGNASVAITYSGSIQIDGNFNTRLFGFSRNRSYTCTLCKHNPM